MKKYKLEKVTDMIFGNRGTILASSFLFLIGISSGIFLELAMDDGDKMHAAQFLSQYLYIGSSGNIDYPNPFFSGLSSNLLMLVIMMISGLVSIGFPVAYAVLVYKGLALGFSAGLLIEHFAFAGIGSMLVTMLPQNLILIPSFILAASTTQNHSLTLAANKAGRYAKNGRNPYPDTDRYIIAYIILAFAIVFACLIEAIIFPFLQA